MTVSTLVSDPRPIKTICFQDGVKVTVGKQGVEKIEAYDELGVGDFLPWLAVHKAGEIVLRVPAHYAAVVYIDPENRNDRDR